MKPERVCFTPDGKAGGSESGSTLGDQGFRFAQENLRKDPVEPKSLHGGAPVQLAFEFVPDDFTGLSQLRSGFIGFAKLLV